MTAVLPVTEEMLVVSLPSSSSSSLSDGLSPGAGDAPPLFPSPTRDKLSSAFVPPFPVAFFFFLAFNLALTWSSVFFAKKRNTFLPLYYH